MTALVLDAGGNSSLPRGFWLSQHANSAVLTAWVRFWESIRRLSAPSSLEERFADLALEWKEETFVLSNPDDIKGAHAYAELLGLGRESIPLILRELETQPFYWFDLLYDLTGETPFPREHAGNVHQMREAWRKWAVQNGII